MYSALKLGGKVLGEEKGKGRFWAETEGEVHSSSNCEGCTYRLFFNLLSVCMQQKKKIRIHWDCSF